jgi:hypothetical protein
MPYSGSQSNKCFTLELVVGDDTGQQKVTSLDQYNALPYWTQFTILFENSDFPLKWIEIRAMTNKGNGLYPDFDKSVYVDNFSLFIIPGP